MKWQVASGSQDTADFVWYKIIDITSSGRLFELAVRHEISYDQMHIKITIDSVVQTYDLSGLFPAWLEHIIFSTNQAVFFSFNLEFADSLKIQVLNDIGARRLIEYWLLYAIVNV